MNPSALVSFHLGGTDERGRTAAEILAWDRDRLERTHDYIQWLFPLRERSGANPSAPVLSDADVRAFRNDARLRASLVMALRAMLGFYGLELRDDRQAGPVVLRMSEFDRRATGWITPGNHNLLRLTRMLRSLRVTGLGLHAKALFHELAGIYRDYAAIIGAGTFEHWQRSMTDPELD